jgi:hypothetical protein
MTDRKTVLKYAHLGAGKTGRAKEIVDANRAAHEDVQEIFTEQEKINAASGDAEPSFPRLWLAERYANVGVGASALMRGP